MALISESEFVKIITSLMKQHDLDVAYCKKLSELINGNDIPVYDNSVLVNCLISYLQGYFPPLHGDCEIERFCFELNFGRANGSDDAVIEPSDLYYSLIDNLHKQ